jgi:hypothetical protein
MSHIIGTLVWLRLLRGCVRHERDAAPGAAPQARTAFETALPQETIRSLDRSD